MVLLSIGFFFISNLQVNAQSSDSLTVANQAFSKGKELRKEENNLAAQNNFLLAFRLYEDNQDWVNWYKSIIQLRKVGTALKQYHQTFDSLQVWEKRVPIDEPKIRGKLIFYQAFMLNNILGKQITGIQRFKDAIQPLEEAADTSFIIACYENISFGYSKLGDQLSAINYLTEGYKLALQSSKKYRLCSILTTLGKYYFHNDDLTTAKVTYIESIDLCENKEEIYLYLSELNLGLNEVEEARTYLDKIDTTDLHIQTDLSLGLAQYFKKKMEYHAAALEQKKAVDNLQEGWDRRKYMKELVIYAEILMLDNRPTQAVQNAHIAICEFLDCRDSLDFKTRPNSQKLVSEIWVIEALYLKASYFQHKYLTTLDESAKEESIFYYNFLFKLFDKLRGNYYAVGSKYRMGVYGQKIYADAINFLFKLYETDPKTQYLARAFELSQLANSYVLKNTISEKESLEYSNISIDSILQYQQIALLLKEQIEKDTLDDGFHMQSKEYDNFKNSLKANYPNFNLEPKEYFISLSEIKSSLGKKSALLKYFQHGNELFLFAITKNDQYMKKVACPSEFRTLIDEINTTMVGLHSNTENYTELKGKYIDHSKMVYRTILADVLNHDMFNAIDHFYIVPDGDIKKISFSTLITGNSEDLTDPANYLLSKYATSYLHYCAQLKQVEAQKKTNRTGFVGLGIEYDMGFLEEIMDRFKTTPIENYAAENMRGIHISPLKFSVDEVIQGSKILNGEYFINEEVNPKGVLQKIRNKEIVHFSVHALVDNDDYYNSFILLNKDSTDNFKLTYRDILMENINCDLVVLSACQTSFGQNLVGEGLMSMTRAFMQSGSDATLGSYWNAPDKSTMEVMGLFYANIKEGMTKSKALQQAQLSYLSDDKRSTARTKLPNFWGAWVIYGSDHPIRQKSRYLYLWLIGLIPLIYLAYKYRKGSSRRSIHS